MKKKHRLNTILPLAAVATAILVLTTASAHAELVVHYKLDETGGLVASDATGNGYTGAVSTAFGSTTGSPDPTSSLAYSTTVASTLLTGQAPAGDTSFTLMFWLKWDPNEEFNRLFTIGNKERNAGDTGWDGNEIIFALVDEECCPPAALEVVYNNEPFGSSTDPLPTSGVWQHHAVVVDGTSVEWFVGASSVWSGTSANQVGSDEFYILGSAHELGDGVSGSIDEVGLFDTVLSQSEILGFMTNGLEGTTPAADPEITSITVADGIATIIMKGTDGTDYTCMSSTTLGGFITDPTTSPSPITTTEGTATFTVDASEVKNFYVVEEVEVVEE